MSMFVAGFAAGVIAMILLGASAEDDRRLLRKILGHLDPEDPDGEV